jgi:hypothetical protein
MNAETIILITLLNFFVFRLINGPHKLGVWFRENYLDFCPEKMQIALDRVCSKLFPKQKGVLII